MSKFLASFLKDALRDNPSSSSTSSSMIQDLNKQETEVDLYSNLQKSTILQEARCFNDKQINEKKCRLLLARLLYLINQGENFLETESTTLFFSITKLFQSENSQLRRIIYLFIKELQKEPSIYIMTSSLLKDMNSKIDLFRMNALRTAAIIIEPQHLIQTERYIKNAIVEKNQSIAVAALLAGIQLYPQNTEFVKKWSNEILEKLNSKSYLAYYHALILLREIKSQDRNSFLKILINLTKDNITNNIGSIQLIRFIREFIMSGELESQNEKIFVDFLEKELHKTSDMVVFEAAKTLCDIKSLSNKNLIACISIIWLYLNSSSSINKFAALKIINRLISNPSRISLINGTQEIENLIRDNNKSISSYAISIMLKISKEEEIENLLNQIQEFLTDSTDEFKVDIIYSIHGLVKKHPNKYKTLINFYSSCLKLDGNYQFKNAIIESIEIITLENPQAKQLGLLTLCEYIEDCQYPELHIRIMNLLAREASSVQNPHKFIRLINNRIVLENADIRAVALTTLGKFALNKPILIPEIRYIIQSELDDNDTEVRARACYYLEEMNKIQAGEEDELDIIQKPILLEDIEAIDAYLKTNLEAIQRNINTDILSLDYITKYVKEHNLLNTKKPKEIQDKKSDNYINPEIDLKSQKSLQDNLCQKYRHLFKSNEYFAGLGDVKIVTDYKQITDSKAEYLVKLRKILFDDYIVLEFNITNTLPNNILKEVSIHLNPFNDNLKIINTTYINEIKMNESGNSYIILAKNPEFKILIFSSADSFLKFKVREVTNEGRPKGTEYDDEYQLEEISVGVNDYIQDYLPPTDKKFDKYWLELSQKDYTQLESSYQLSYKTLDTAIKSLIKHFGMTICENSDVINANQKHHNLLLSGLYLGYIEIYLHAIIGFDANLGCVMKLKGLSKDSILLNNILDTIS